MKNKNIGYFVLMMLFCGLFTNSMQAQDVFTWTGTIDTNWTTAGNWSKSGAEGADNYPGETRTLDEVIINTGTPLLSNEVTIAKLDLNGTSVSTPVFTINNGASLTIALNQSFNAALTMDPDAGFTSTLINNGSIIINSDFDIGILIVGQANSTINFTNNGSLDVAVGNYIGLQFGLRNTDSGAAAYNFTNTGIVNMTSTNRGIPFNSYNSKKTPIQIVTINNTSTGNWTIDTDNGSIELFEDGIFENDGHLTLSYDLGSNSGTTVLNNNTSGVLTFTGSNSVMGNTALAASVVFTNEGTVNTNTGSTNGVDLLSVNTFTSGTLSPGGDTGKGVMGLAAQSPVTSPIPLNVILKMQIDGNTTAGVDYDQIMAPGMSDAGFDIGGATLDITGIYTPAGDTTIDILMADGTGTINNIFADVIGLVGGWTVSYGTTGSVQLVFGLGTVWTGTVNSDWSNAGNWTNDVPNTFSDIMIPPPLPKTYGN